MTSGVPVDSVDPARGPARDGAPSLPCAPRARLESALTAAWLRRGPLAGALWPMSLAYRALRAMRAPVVADRLPVPVIVIGNVVAGGAGKTPTTLAVARHLRARGWQPGILSRGHGRDGDGARLVAPDDDPRAVGDEPLLLAQALARPSPDMPANTPARAPADTGGIPVAVARERAQAGRALLAAHPGLDVLICDDGLQHRQLARDVEICVFDARGIGNGWLLPAGPLREPWPRSVDLALGTEGVLNVPLPPGAQAFVARRHLADHARRANGARVAWADLQRPGRGQPLVALAGIARPQAFFDMLRAAGLPLAQALALPDHDDLSGAARALDPHATLICTEKDAVKLWRWRPDAWAAPLALEVPGAFFAALDALLAARGYHPRASLSLPG